MINAAIVGLGRWWRTLVAAYRATASRATATGCKRFFPAMQELARIAASGELGRLLHIEAQFQQRGGGDDVLAVARFTRRVAGRRDDRHRHPRARRDDPRGRTGAPCAGAAAVAPPAPDPLDTISVLLEFRSGVSGLLAAVRSTPLFLAHPCLRTRQLRRGSRPHRARRCAERRECRNVSLFADVDSVRANLEAFADAVAGTAPYPISTGEMVDVVAAFEAIALAAASDGTRARESNLSADVLTRRAGMADSERWRLQSGP